MAPKPKEKSIGRKDFRNEFPAGDGDLFFLWTSVWRLEYNFSRKIPTRNGLNFDFERNVFSTTMAGVSQRL